jgi:hypothetical protein
VLADWLWSHQRPAGRTRAILTDLVRWPSPKVHGRRDGSQHDGDGRDVACAWPGGSAHAVAVND